MGKFKNALAILLTLVLLAGGGLLPFTAAELQDRTATNVAQYESVEALQLKLEEAAPAITYLEKLYLMVNGMGEEYTTEATKITPEEVLARTYQALTPYMELFFGKGIDNDYLEYYPVQIYDEKDPGKGCLLWHVTLSLDVSGQDTVTMILDDETGQILAMEMIDPELNLEAEYLQELQYALAATYFAQLDITPVGDFPFALADPDDTEVALAATAYQFVEPNYNTDVVVEIGVRTDGFYIYAV